MRKIGTYFYAGLSVVVLLISLYVYNLSRDYTDVKKNPLIGNTDDIIDKLSKQESKQEFSFGFISDTENNDASIWLFENLLKSEIAFLVITGDFVNDAVESEYKLFLYTFEKINPKVPVFLVPSNHDLELSAKKEKYGKGDFENIFGPANFSFLYNGCLFIFISNIDQNDKEYCIYLEKLLSGRGPDIKKTFLFCPTPPRKVLNEVFPKSSQWTGDFDRIIEQYKVNYVISGDYHKHYELSSDVGVHYIVSGPGGSHFREKSLLGRIKSGTIMTVYPDHVTQQLLVCDKIVLTDNSIRHYIYKEILSKLSPKFGIINAIFAILILNALFAMYKFIRSVSV